VLFSSLYPKIVMSANNLPADGGLSPAQAAEHEEGIMGRRGITLVELVIVLSIIVVLIASAVFSYEKWMGNYQVESNTVELYADLMRARLMAMQKSRKHFLTTDEHSYTIFEDRNENGSPEQGEELPSFPKKVRHILRSNVASALSFNTRGIMQVPRTLRFDMADSGLRPDYDCIKISKTRIVVGRYRGTECEID
jgi:type II secretory pathway pseudopilin PulG